ncbi:uncharacterized protein LOC143361026 [Halictus rubicundus]|uniref:uncharacterized protein LOC143361026 n=1 Tax=Halictus rubicundus TaxID=77578 RepID=UPI00403616EA
MSESSGNTNDVNTARRAFQDKRILEEIPGVDINLLQKMKIILITICSQFPINLKKFQIFCSETAELFMKKYSWYPMTPTVHKILIHGKQILEQCILPPGYLGEDAAESKNKYYKYDMAHHARQNSRKNNLHDVFHRAMGTSDPFISTISLNNRRQKQYKNKLLPSEVLISTMSSVY